MKKCLNKFLCALGCVFGTVAAFAQEGGGSGSIDVGIATQAFSDAEGALTGFVSSNAPVISTILGAFVGLTLIFVAYGWIRRAAKGR